MAKPVILAVEDPPVLRPAERDLRRRYFLQKPWDTPDQNLYPSLDELQADWRADYGWPFGRLPLEVWTQNGG